MNENSMIDYLFSITNDQAECSDVDGNSEWII